MIISIKFIKESDFTGLMFPFVKGCEIDSATLTLH